MQTDMRKARTEALKYADDIISFNEIVKAFREHKETRVCDCGGIIEGWLKTSDLTFIFLPVCPNCETTKLTTEKNNAISEWINWRQQNIKNILTSCGVPPLFIDAKKEDVSKAMWADILNAFKTKSILLTGDSGIGKSHIAIALMREYLLEEQPLVNKRQNRFILESPALPVFIPVINLLAEIRRTFRDGSIKTEESVINLYSDLPLLILDDLGAEKTSEWSIQTLYQIINNRMMYLRKTIFTTNCNPDVIEKNFNAISEYSGTRIMSRIVGMCEVRELKCKDRRLTK